MSNTKDLSDKLKDFSPFDIVTTCLNAMMDPILLDTYSLRLTDCFFKHLKLCDKQVRLTDEQTHTIIALLIKRMDSVVHVNAKVEAWTVDFALEYNFFEELVK